MGKHVVVITAGIVTAATLMLGIACLAPWHMRIYFTLIVLPVLQVDTGLLSVYFHSQARSIEPFLQKLVDKGTLAPEFPDRFVAHTSGRKLLFDAQDYFCAVAANPGLGALMPQACSAMRSAFLGGIICFSLVVLAMIAMYVGVALLYIYTFKLPRAWVRQTAALFFGVAPVFLVGVLGGMALATSPMDNITGGGLLATFKVFQAANGDTGLAWGFWLAGASMIPVSLPVALYRTWKIKAEESYLDLREERVFQAEQMLAGNMAAAAAASSERAPLMTNYQSGHTPYV